VLHLCEPKWLVKFFFLSVQSPYMIHACFAVCMIYPSCSPGTVIAKQACNSFFLGSSPREVGWPRLPFFYDGERVSIHSLD